ncbi:hypothetical protein SLS62_008465 [Diatrype stigma]|uniref:Carboxylic ester hydrolase n=1 Tax=Diatrype stigma TaxID=117547 RepID=A0AAN9UJG1_9PEZI
MRRAAAGVALAGLLGLAEVASAKLVKTPNKLSIQGGTCKTTAVDSFFSIPYAKPPVGDLRYAAPEPYAPPSCGIVINATNPTPSCIQFGTAFEETGSQSEDCLYLNIWAPSSATPGSDLPVKVWLFGGGNEGGGVSDPTYDGCYTAQDSILVSINYRLGPLGFLALTDLGLSGNYGTQDQLLGLRWVQDNIQSFGGDPNKVLLFGESAGATNTFVLATRPDAPKLMRAAAMESGGGRDIATVAEAQTYQKIFFEQLNCSTPDIACVRAASPSLLQAAYAAVPGEPAPGVQTPFSSNGSRSSWSPLVDGVVIAGQPSAAGLQVPSILGSNSQEGALFVLASYGAGAAALTQADYDAFLAYNFGPLAARVNDTFSVSDVFNGSVAAAMTVVVTDVSYKCSAHRGLLGAGGSSGKGKGVPVWTYRFAHEPDCAWYANIPAQYVSVLGATHSSEIPFVFNMTTNMPPPDGNCTFPAAGQKIAHTLSRAWTNMAEFGAPGPDEDAWPAWTSDNSTGLVVNDAVEVGKVDYDSCAFWDEINTALNKYAAGQ